jgi:hypothetical protein
MVLDLEITKISHLNLKLMVLDLEITKISHLKCEILVENRITVYSLTVWYQTGCIRRIRQNFDSIRIIYITYTTSDIVYYTACQPYTSPVGVTFDPKAPRTGARRACRGLASRQDWSALPSLQPTVGPGPHFPPVLTQHGVRLERGEAAEALQARREHGAARCVEPSAAEREALEARRQGRGERLRAFLPRRTVDIPQ